jgi:hypothetical protein
MRLLLRRFLWFPAWLFFWVALGISSCVIFFICCWLFVTQDENILDEMKRFWVDCFYEFPSFPQEVE